MILALAPFLEISINPEPILPVNLIKVAIALVDSSKNIKNIEICMIP
jgi:hypothetical protein